MDLKFLKREDGSWNVGLILALAVAVLAVLAGGYAVYKFYTNSFDSNVWRLWGANTPAEQQHIYGMDGGTL